MNVRNIRIEDYDYPLPDGRIALHPLEQRDGCKLLFASGKRKTAHHLFSDLPLLLKPDTLIVANETKVIRARLEFEKSTGARIEIFLLEPESPRDYATSFASLQGCSWNCMIGNRKRWKEGPLTKKISIGERELELRATLEGETEVRFSWSDPSFSFAEIIEAAGNIPIPPYLRRESEESDTSDYQTVYSHTQGSVAAPTAGLHFTTELISRLKRRGIEFVTVTLHVGAGTFQPVKSEEIGGHPMHSEWISVEKLTLKRIISALENGRDILAVGTTSVRTLESLPYFGKNLPERTVTQWMPYEPENREIDTVRALKNIVAYLEENGLDRFEATTSIMIAPGFRWRIVDRLVTNFHQPKSTLLLLVSSFLGDDAGKEGRWKAIYDEALEKGYRFLSYGDACLFNRGEQSVELPLAKSMVIRGATIMARRDPAGLRKLEAGLLCDDAFHYIRALEKVLASVSSDSPADIFIGEGAAPLRFLTAFAASLPGSKARIECGAPLKKRPLMPLVETLRELGADIEFEPDPSDWRLAVRGRRLKGRPIVPEGNYTSQYVSALMLASPLWEGGRESLGRLESEVSRPYVRMTEKMLGEEDVTIEPDWSAAAFFYEKAAVMRREVVISRLTRPEKSLQGDAAACGVFEGLGVKTEFNDDGSATLTFTETGANDGIFEHDFTDTPDMVPAVAVALCHAGRPFRLTGVSHLRYKECDRLAGLQRNLMRLGYEVTAEGDSLEFNGEFRPMEEFPVTLDSYGDHRMVMAFYPLEMKGMAVIEDKSVVSKSFPNFFAQMK